VLRAIALFASSRRNGNTGQLMDRITKELEIEVVDLGNARMSAYDYEHRNRDDDFEPLMKRVLDFDQIIFASPVYWYSVSPPMKVFLDRISDFLDLPDLLNDRRRLRGKQAYIVWRRALVLILHDSMQPATIPASDWMPKGLCKG